MSHQIHIRVGEVQLRAELNDSDTAKSIHNALPIAAAANRWGEEIYFEIPVDEPLTAEASENVHVGELGYWPPGKAFCIFFGPTPASTGDAPRAASPVNRIGRVLDDVRVLADVPHGAEVRLERA
ncbi:MAG: hypothetical protein JSW71_23140 [Gemmatimonadota bacterium]|nr:MAG: hypothetical protein JSW71_23140 [Gemmatimonadota bacterium]